jgi:hypothetical protein
VISFLAKALTGKDNDTLDIGRILWAGSAVMLWWLEAYTVIIGHTTFDMMAFAGATGTVLTTGAASLFFKRTTEPGG